MSTKERSPIPSFDGNASSANGLMIENHVPVLPDSVDRDRAILNSVLDTMTSMQGSLRDIGESLEIIIENNARATAIRLEERARFEARWAELERQSDENWRQIREATRAREEATRALEEATRALEEATRAREEATRAREEMDERHRIEFRESDARWARREEESLRQKEKDEEDMRLLEERGRELEEQLQKLQKEQEKLDKQREAREQGLLQKEQEERENEAYVAKWKEIIRQQDEAGIKIEEPPLPQFLVDALKYQPPKKSHASLQECLNEIKNLFNQLLDLFSQLTTTSKKETNHYTYGVSNQHNRMFTHPKPTFKNKHPENKQEEQQTASWTLGSGMGKR